MWLLFYFIIIIVFKIMCGLLMLRTIMIKYFGKCQFKQRGSIFLQLLQNERGNIHIYLWNSMANNTFHKEVISLSKKK